MSINQLFSDVSPWDNSAQSEIPSNAIILAAGFEDRAFEILDKGSFKEGAVCILIRFRNGVPGNKVMYRKYFSRACEVFGDDSVFTVDLRSDEPSSLSKSMFNCLRENDSKISQIAIDVSGMPAHAICQVLRCVREFRAEEKQTLLYTAAKDYLPKKEDCAEILAGKSAIELMPDSLALEMSENLLLDEFRGYRSENARSFLSVFAGFEVHRSAGVIDAINPSMLLLMYGLPGEKQNSWRINLSKILHEKFETGRRAAKEEVSTLQIGESISTLEKYYHFMIDDYDMILSPVGSKMQTVASYLFWEQYGEIQLTFPIPIGYNPENRPKGVSGSYIATLYPKSTIYREPIDNGKKH